MLNSVHKPLGPFCTIIRNILDVIGKKNVPKSKGLMKLMTTFMRLASSHYRTIQYVIIKIYIYEIMIVIFIIVQSVIFQQSSDGIYMEYSRMTRFFSYIKQCIKAINNIMI